MARWNKSILNLDALKCTPLAYTPFSMVAKFISKCNRPILLLPFSFSGYWYTIENFNIFLRCFISFMNITKKNESKLKLWQVFYFGYIKRITFCKTEIGYNK